MYLKFRLSLCVCVCNFSTVILAGHRRGGVREGRAESHLPQAASRVCGGWAVFWGLPSASAQPCPVSRLSRRCTWAAGTRLPSSLRGWPSRHAPHQDREPGTAPCADPWDLTASCRPPPKLGAACSCSCWEPRAQTVGTAQDVVTGAWRSGEDPGSGTTFTWG